MMVLVAGATGKTGRLLVERLLGRDHGVRVIVRSVSRLPASVVADPNATVIEASILDLTDEQLLEHVRGCDAVVSCLGHVMSFEGMFREPKQLCTEATRRLCEAISRTSPTRPIQFILMSTVGVPNPELDEKRSWFERGLLSVLHHALPPHRDNETAAEYLHQGLGTSDESIEWCAVRPDTLVDEETSPHDIGESPTTGILSGRPTSRANVAHFMAELLESPDLWHAWRFKMPVIMNAE